MSTETKALEPAPASAAAAKKERNRSPAYPAFGLPEAIRKLQAFHKENAFNWAYSQLAIKSLGYKHTGSTGLRALAALLHFGLLEEAGSGKDRKVRISQRGRTILLAPGERQDERQRAVAAAALAPKVYQNLWTKFGPNLPTVQNLEYELARGDEYNHQIIRDLVRDFVATVEFAKLGASATLESELEGGDNGAPPDGGPEKPPTPLRQQRDKPMPEMQGNTWDLPVPLIGGKQAILRIPLPLSEANFTLLKGFLLNSLDATKAALVTSEPEPSQQ